MARAIRCSCGDSVVTAHKIEYASIPGLTVIAGEAANPYHETSRGAFCSPTEG